jgi:hypothetical protein
MKKVILALSLFAFVGASTVEAAVISKPRTEKTDKKEKKEKKNKKGCTTAEMKSCSAGAATKSCCAKKAGSAAAAPSVQ